jgi:hypothetical protein
LSVSSSTDVDGDDNGVDDDIDMAEDDGDIAAEGDTGNDMVDNGGDEDETTLSAPAREPGVRGCTEPLQ